MTHLFAGQRAQRRARPVFVELQIVADPGHAALPRQLLADAARQGRLARAVDPQHGQDQALPGPLDPAMTVAGLGLGQLADHLLQRGRDIPASGAEASGRPDHHPVPDRQGHRAMPGKGALRTVEKDGNDRHVAIRLGEPSHAAAKPSHCARLPAGAFGKDDDPLPGLERLAHRGDRLFRRTATRDPDRPEQVIRQPEQDGTTLEVIPGGHRAGGADSPRGQHAEQQQHIEMAVVVGGDDDLIPAIEMLATFHADPEQRAQQRPQDQQMDPGSRRQPGTGLGHTK